MYLSLGSARNWTISASHCTFASSALSAVSYTITMRPKLGKGTHWLITPCASKCSRRTGTSAGKDMRGIVAINEFVGTRVGDAEVGEAGAEDDCAAMVVWK